MTDPRIHERRVLVAREKGRHRRRWLIAGLVGLLVAAGGFAVVHSSVLGARHVEVTGSAHTPYSTIVKVAGLRGAPPLIDLSPAVIAERVEALPWVDTAVVSVAWPSTVRIRLTERTPVAVLPAGPAGWAVADPTGRVLEDLAARPAGLPEIASSGALPPPGKRLPAHLGTLARVAAAMPESMVPEIADIRWDSEGIVAEMSHKLVAVLGSASMLEDKFVALATVLAHGGLTGIGTIDLRVPAAPVLIRQSASPIVARSVGG
ncbi:MAG: cell division protein FtsQ/DivIB [Acidimicrobiales bacterium]